MGQKQEPVWDMVRCCAVTNSLTTTFFVLTSNIQQHPPKSNWKGSQECPLAWRECYFDRRGRDPGSLASEGHETKPFRPPPFRPKSARGHLLGPLADLLLLPMPKSERKPEV